MARKPFLRLRSTLVCGLLMGCAAPAARMDPTAPPDAKARFLALCDLATAELNKDITPFNDRDSSDPRTHHMPFFEDAHAVRALAVAYDLSSEPRYLAACRRWADHVLDCQSRMIPKAAYYMNYLRPPGQDHGVWCVADSGSIGMGVLATAVRCPNPADRARYLDSVRAFAQLVIDNDVEPDGGINNGLWPQYADSWWCSTATFGSLSFLLYEQTKEERYLKIATRALEWMISRDFRKAGPITFQERPSGVIFYCFEFIALGLKYLRPDHPQYACAMQQIDLALAWMRQNQKTQGAAVRDYTDGVVDMAGLPYLMYAFARQLPAHHDQVPPADAELRYIGDLLLGSGEINVSRLAVWEVMTWGMLSYAERLMPAALWRSTWPRRGQGL